MERQHAINIIEIAKIKLPSIADEIHEAITTLSAPSWINFKNNPPKIDGEYIFLIKDMHKKYGCFRIDMAMYKNGRYQGAWNINVQIGSAEIIGYLCIPNPNNITN